MSRSVAGTALYFAILQGWLYQDASLVYQVKNLIAILLCYAMVRTACALTLPRNGPVAQASQGFSGSTAP